MLANLPEPVEPMVEDMRGLAHSALAGLRGSEPAAAAA